MPTCSKGWAGRCESGRGARCRCACGGANHGAARRRQLALELEADDGEACFVDVPGGLPGAPVPIGARVRLDRALFGAPAGTLLPVVGHYRRPDDDDAVGMTIRFPDGTLEGFSRRDLEACAIPAPGLRLHGSTSRVLHVKRVTR